MKYFIIFFIFYKNELIKENKNKDNFGKICNNSILQTYDIQGLNISNQNKIVTKICPNTINSCCTENDIKKSIDKWNNDVSKKIENHYENYLTYLIEIFKFKNNIFEKLKKITKNNSPECVDSVNNTQFFINNIKETDKIIKFYTITFELLAFLKKGTICSVCNADNHKFFTTNENLEDNKKIGKIILSEKFCIDFVTLLQEYMRYKINNVLPFLINLNIIQNCMLEDKVGFIYDFKNIKFDDFKECFNNKEKFDPSNIICKKFCKNYNFNELTDIFDSNVENLHNFYKRISKIEEFKDDKFKILNIKNDRILYKNKNPLYDLSNYEILIKDNGINLFNDANNNGFELKINTKNENNYENIKNEKFQIYKFPQKNYLNKELTNNQIDYLKKKLKIKNFPKKNMPDMDFIDNLLKTIENKEIKYLDQINPKKIIILKIILFLNIFFIN